MSDLFIDLLFASILLLGAATAWKDMSKKATYAWAKGEGQGVVTRLYTESQTQTTRDSKGNRIGSKQVDFRMAKVAFNGAERSMRNTEALREGQKVLVRFPVDEPSNWKPMRRYDLSFASIIFPGIKDISLMMAYTAFWITVLIAGFLIRLALLPARPSRRW
ncbi:DUF3592 domain-containing protein [Motilimonas eburnea]|uniref:DUF3592 domain-containing protein n=1 Tax=Motilimonas eburnea TaxID=1737488 RepID=UPI001E57E7C6|nr:DUF3592 domain-containing protein [Motilimonas eburnea]MCE2572203.1 DUF3592 domain-containing protein [Motilimonas eburnea]